MNFIWHWSDVSRGIIVYPQCCRYLISLSRHWSLGGQFFFFQFFSYNAPFFAEEFLWLYTHNFICKEWYSLWWWCWIRDKNLQKSFPRFWARGESKKCIFCKAGSLITKQLVHVTGNNGIVLRIDDESSSLFSQRQLYLLMTFMSPFIISHYCNTQSDF